MSSRRRQGVDHTTLAHIAAALAASQDRAQLACQRLQVGNPGLDLGQVRLGDPIDPRAIRPTPLRQVDQPADLVVRKPQIARPPDETQPSDGLRTVEALAAVATRRLGQKTGLPRNIGW